MQLQAVQRTAAVLELLVAAGAPPVPAEQQCIPMLSPEAWQFLRLAATAWPQQWSQGAHRQYHASFRAGARALLLAARRGFVAPPCSGADDGGEQASRPSGTSVERGGMPEVRQRPPPREYHLPPLVIERVVQLMAQRQRDWVQPS